MSQFKTLLRQSRVFSLPPEHLAIRSEHVPKQQVLETTAASFHRRNWGLKGPLPTKAKSTLITYGRMESDVGFPDIDYNPNFLRKVTKFSELGTRVQLAPSNSEFPSLFATGSRPFPAVSQLGRRKLRKAMADAEDRRQEYLAYIKSRPMAAIGANGSTFSAAQSPATAERFLGLQTSSTPTQTAISAIGLSYELKGVIHNSLNGLQSARIVPGRVLARRANSVSSAAVGGFVARMISPASAQEGVTVVHEKTVPFRVERVVSSPDGEVNLSVSPAPTRRPTLDLTKMRF